jgi:hypothetical protein
MTGTCIGILCVGQSHKVALEIEVFSGTQYDITVGRSYYWGFRFFL